MKQTFEGREKVRTIKDSVLIILFVSAICLPSVGMALRLDVVSERQENRRLAKFPPVALNMGVLDPFPERFREYFNDNLGFRNTLIRWQANIKVNYLGTSSSPQVIIGRDGWLFYADEFSPGGRRAVPLFTERQLERWRRILEARRDWLKQRGIRYLFTLAPSKQTIYPEYLPETLTPIARQSRINQLTAYLKQHSDLEFVDLGPPLYEAKARRLLFPKTYSHWNFYGAFIAYQAVMRKLAASSSELQPVSEADCEFITQKVEQGDLAKMLGIPDSKTEETLIMGLRRPSYIVTSAKELQDNAIVDKPIKSSDKLDVIIRNTYKLEFVAAERKGTKLPRALILHDSAFINTMPFFPQHFSRTVFRWTPVLDLDLIKAERPDIVIQDVGEMLLMIPPPADAPEVTSLTLSNRRRNAQDSSDKSSMPADYNGFHDVADCASISGWAWDKNRPAAFHEVEIYDGDKLIATVPADIYREDLLNAGIGDGEYGFSYQLPPSIKDGRPHSIRVKIAGTDFILKNSPKSVTCGP